MKDMADVKNDSFFMVKKIIFSALIIAVAIPLFFLFNPATYSGSFFRFFLLYVALLLLFNVFKSNHFARFFLKILLMPGILLITFYPFLLAILSVVLSYGIVYGFAIFLFEIIPTDLFHVHLTKAVIVYFEITISSLVVAYFYDKVIAIGDYIFFRKNNDEHKKLSQKIMNQSRAKFSIYFFYFVALLILNSTRLNGSPVIESLSLEKAILESFGTFLAFERVISNWKFFMEEKAHR